MFIGGFVSDEIVKVVVQIEGKSMMKKDWVTR